MQVSHAWLQGETTLAGCLTDANIVCQTVQVISHCAESLSTATHLAVIRALLTIATSEHFVAHGEALVQCVKVVFNLAIATEDRTVALTAQNALLQARLLLPDNNCHGARVRCSVPCCCAFMRRL